ncbi:MAG TPA: hypothetical protein ENJ83_04920 [Rhodospirillales bacterium]|nr:hypothetical protein [Rhodospirillales bacterium]
MTVPLDRRRRWAAWHEAGHVLGFVRAGILPAARLYGDGSGIAYPARIVEPDAAASQPSPAGSTGRDGSRARKSPRCSPDGGVAGPPGRPENAVATRARVR